MSDYHEMVESISDFIGHDPNYPIDGGREERHDESDNRPRNPDKWFSDEDTSGG